MESRCSRITIKITAKDGILSYTSSIFDPLGILAPIIPEPKLIIQSLWKQRINCDREKPTDFKTDIFTMEGKITILGCDPNSTMVRIKQ